MKITAFVPGAKSSLACTGKLFQFYQRQNTGVEGYKN